MNIRSAVTLIVGVLLIAAAIVLAVATDANAKVVRIEDPQTEMIERNPVLYVEHVHRRWFYAELADGSAWMVTRCRHEDSNNCWWDARRNDGEGRSFVAIRRHHHMAVRGTVVR